MVGLLGDMLVVGSLGIARDHGGAGSVRPVAGRGGFSIPVPRAHAAIRNAHLAKGCSTLSFCAVISAMAGELFMARWMVSLVASWLYLTILALSSAAGWMKTPQTITSSSAAVAGIIPSATQSATALATAYWAGPNICTACFIPLIVTLVIRTVAGLAIRFGVRTASRLVCSADWFARALANASPTGPSFLPISRSMCAISLPSPTRASPTFMTMSAAIFRVSVV